MILQNGTPFGVKSHNDIDFLSITVLRHEIFH